LDCEWDEVLSFGSSCQGRPSPQDGGRNFLSLPPLPRVPILGLRRLTAGMGNMLIKDLEKNILENEREILWNWNVGQCPT